MITANEARELVTKWHDGRARRAELFMIEEFPRIEAKIKLMAAAGYPSVVYTVPAEVVDGVVKALPTFKIEVEDGYPTKHKQLTISWGE